MDSKKLPSIMEYMAPTNANNEANFNRTLLDILKGQTHIRT
jgi:hypothetical protein